MDSALLAAAFWGLWRGRRRDREWQRTCDEDIQKVIQGDPGSVELTVAGLRSEIGNRLDYAIKQMRELGYRLVGVVPQDSELAWTARFDRTRRELR